VKGVKNQTVYDWLIELAESPQSKGNEKGAGAGGVQGKRYTVENNI